MRAAPPASVTGEATRHRALWWLLGAIVVAAGAWLRWGTLRSIPSFFGPGDPAIYFGMGRGVLREGLPVQDFIHHYLTLPPEIRHLEDYYEPVFGYLVAAAMALEGATPQAAAGVSFVAGVLVMPLAGLLARPRGLAAAVVAMAVVALEPWSIYYSAVLMKEAMIALTTLGALHATVRLSHGPAPDEVDRSAVRDGALVAGIAFAAGLLQYESLPILGLACGAALLRHRRQALLPYACALGLLVAAFALLTWWGLGVPVSAKLRFVAGFDPGDPSGTGAAAALLHRSTLFPLGYILQSTLTGWYPLLLLVGLRGLALPDASATARTWIVTYLALHLWLHGIPHDLWSRDFIVLTALLAAPAAAALVAWRAWAASPTVAGLAWGANAFLWLTPSALSLLAARVPGFERLTFGLRIACMLPVAILLALLFRRLHTGARARPFALATSLALGASLAGQFWLALPYPAIPLNPQYPNFEIERARRQRVSEWMRAQVPRGPVVAEHAEEVASYSGFPAAIMPEVFQRRSFAMLIGRYRVRYVLAREGLVPDSVMASVPFRRVGSREGYALYAAASADTIESR